jgi:hypothetical protein
MCGGLPRGVGVGELEVEDVVVLADPGRIAGLGDHDRGDLQVPADNNLPDGLAMHSPDLGQDRIVESSKAGKSIN